MNTEEKIKKQLEENPVILYMKGTPDMPSCGFSAKAAAAIKSTGVAFAHVNVLEAPFIMEKLPDVSNWPTYPQLFVNGEIVGGCDIVEELLMSGELAPLLQQATSEPA
ncbi:MAG: Grx4 family monothiol glutaredoxin [Gammaproteobacteria bacterium]